MEKRGRSHVVFSRVVRVGFHKRRIRRPILIRIGLMTTALVRSKESDRSRTGKTTL